MLLCVVWDSDLSSSNVIMAPISVVVLGCLALVTFTAATDVQQCSGQRFQKLSENVQLSPCKKPPCRLRKGTNQHITIHFSPDSDIEDIKNHVVAEVFGVPLPFPGVDDVSICDKLFTEDGEKASCPVKAGTKYVYKDSFPVLELYPSIQVRVHWALTNGKKDIVCFEVPAKIS